MNHNYMCSYCEQLIYPSQKSCGTCGNSVAEPQIPIELDVQNVKDETELVEIKLKQPYLIGKIPLKTLLYCGGVLCLSIILLMVNNTFKSWVGLLGLMWCVGYWLDSIPARGKKRCPYCQEKNIFFVGNSEQICAFCQRKVLLIWE